MTGLVMVTSGYQYPVNLNSDRSYTLAVKNPMEEIYLPKGHVVAAYLWPCSRLGRCHMACRLLATDRNISDPGIGR